MEKLTDSQLEVIKVIFKNYQEKSEEVWKIKINGEFFKTNKGKSTWSKEHFARRSLVNFLGHHYGILNVLGVKYGWEPEKIKDSALQLEKIGILEFVRVI